MSILERIHSPADLKALPAGEIPELCAELRSFLVQSLSKTGGHLASNLGAVELTVAIDRVYNTERDRLVFDVGHQSYVHKLLTGRREAFSTLRQYGGIIDMPLSLSTMTIGSPLCPASDSPCAGRATCVSRCCCTW